VDCLAQRCSDVVSIAAHVDRSAVTDPVHGGGNVIAITAPIYGGSNVIAITAPIYGGGDISVMGHGDDGVVVVVMMMVVMMVVIVMMVGLALR